MSTPTTKIPTNTVGDRPAECTEDLGKGSADRLRDDALAWPSCNPCDAVHRTMTCAHHNVWRPKR